MRSMVNHTHATPISAMYRIVTPVVAVGVVLIGMTLEL